MLLLITQPGPAVQWDDTSTSKPTNIFPWNSPLSQKWKCKTTEFKPHFIWKRWKNLTTGGRNLVIIPLLLKLTICWIIYFYRPLIRLWLGLSCLLTSYQGPRGGQSWSHIQKQIEYVVCRCARLGYLQSDPCLFAISWIKISKLLRKSHVVNF